LRGTDRGDELVIVNVSVPKTLSPEQRRLFEELAHTMGTEAQPQQRGLLDWIKEALGG
jgi:molecular chaperone DnaJ